MKLLRKATLLASIFLVLVSVTCTWLVFDTYLEYGWSHQVITIRDGERSEVTETVASTIVITGFLWAYTAILVANFLYLRTSKQRTAEARQPDI